MTPCLSCGHDVPDGATTCPSCGAQLTPPHGAEERRTVTTLFCDLVGFTSLSERNDPELVDAFLRRYYSAARRVIESYGGTLEKFIGDAVVAVFGVPTLHEDDPERAVRAGLRLVNDLGQPAKVRPRGRPCRSSTLDSLGEDVARVGHTTRRESLTFRARE